MKRTYFDLGPDKVSLLYFIGYCPPVLPAFEECFDQHWVITTANKYLELFLYALLELCFDTIRMGYFPYEIIEVVTIKG